LSSRLISLSTAIWKSKAGSSIHDDGRSEEKALASLKNAELLKQFKQVELLPEEDLNTVIKFVGAYIGDFKAKQAYAS